MEAGATTRRRSPRPSGSATRRPIPPRTSPAQTRPRRWRSSPRVAFGTRVELDDVAYEGIDQIRPERVEAARSLDSVVRLVGTARSSTARSTFGSAPRSSAGTIRSRRSRAVQRRDAARGRDPGDHAGRPRRRRPRDRFGGRGGHGERARNNGNRLPPGGRVLALAADAPPGRSAAAVLRQDRGRRPAGSACTRGRAVRGRGCLHRPAAPAGPDGRAALDVVTHTAPSGRVDAALDAIASLPEVHARPEALRVITERGV